MDAVLHEQFQRVEAALGTLVDSIASYNPSPQAAADLIAADEELGRRLDQLAQHQANRDRIQALHAEAEALEEQLRSSVATLASLRRELFETPATTFPENSRPVPFDELLQYAKNISKYTVPPTYRERVPPPKAGQDNDGEDGGSSAAASHAANTPANAAGASAATQEPPKDTAPGQGEEPKDITAEEAEWLKKLNDSQMPWFPWPNNDKIRRGNLMQIQHERDQGNDPAQIDIAGRAEEEKKKVGAVVQVARVAPKPADSPKKPVEAARRVEAPAPQERETKVFTGFDFTEEEEED